MLVTSACQPGIHSVDGTSYCNPYKRSHSTSRSNLLVTTGCFAEPLSEVGSLLQWLMQKRQEPEQGICFTSGTPAKLCSSHFPLNIYTSLLIE